jgi:glutathione reductase (NADPH)
MEARGIRLRLGAPIERVEREEALSVTLSTGERIETDLVMAAIGRSPNTTDLGLEGAGVALDDQEAVIVDDLSRSSVPGIYAIGDCTNRMTLTPVAIAEATAFVRTVFEGKPTPMGYEKIPSAVFSQPNLGTVGLTEARARDQFGEIEVYRSSFRPLKHTLTGREEKTLMKLVVDPVSDRVLGCHMMGPDAGEIIQGIAVALQCGATKAQFDATIGIHPTAAEEFVTMREKAGS